MSRSTVATARSRFPLTKRTSPSRLARSPVDRHLVPSSAHVRHSECSNSKCLVQKNGTVSKGVVGFPEMLQAAT